MNDLIYRVMYFYKGTWWTSKKWTRNFLLAQKRVENAVKEDGKCTLLVLLKNGKEETLINSIHY